MLGRHGDDPQEEEDKRLGDGAEHLDHVVDGCAGTLGNILLYVVLHGQSAGHNPRKQHYAKFLLFGTDARTIDRFKIHSRHDRRDGKELGHQVGQVAVHKYEERLDFSNPGGESRGEGGHKTKKYAEADPA